MSTTTIREVPTGIMVIHSKHDGQFIYDGPADDPRFMRVKFDMRAGRKRLEADPADVAPANEVTVDLADPRIETMLTNTKGTELYKQRPHGAGHWMAADERLDFQSWHKTKTAAVAECAQRLAIADWHAGVTA